MGYYLTLLGSKLILREGQKPIKDMDFDYFIVEYDAEVDGERYYSINLYQDLKWNDGLDAIFEKMAQMFDGYITTLAEDGTPYKFVFKNGKVYVGEGEIVFPDDSFITDDPDNEIQSHNSLFR